MKLIYSFIFAMLCATITIAQPTDNATDPPAREAGDVISIYSDSYANVPGAIYDPNWGQSGHTLVNPTFDPGTGSLILAYPNFNYQGTEFNNSPQDASLMEFLHIDVWVPMGTNRLIKVSPIDNSGVGAPEVLVDLPLVPGAWNSVDLPKSAFGNMSWNSVIQMKFDGQFNSDGSANMDPFDVYLDNVYFWRNATAPGTDVTLSDLQIDGMTIDGFAAATTSYSVSLPGGTTMIPQVTSVVTTDSTATAVITQAMALPGTATINVTGGDSTTMQLYTISYFVGSPTNSPPSPTNDQADVISLYSDAFTNIASIIYDPNWGQSGHTLVNPAFDPGTGDLALAYPNFNYQGMEFNNNAQNASGMEFLHVDVWVANGVDRMLKVSPIDNSGVGAPEVLVEVPLTPGSWNSVDLPKSAFADMSWNSVLQMKFDGQFNSDGSANTDPYDVYLDNIYFWKAPIIAGTDATLSDLLVDGASVDGFSSGTLAYNYGVSGTTMIPEVTAVTTDTNAVADVTQATAIPGDATVVVTSGNGMVMETYTVSFFNETPPDGAPAPTDLEENVISMFSDTYTDVSVDTWNTEWSEATLEDISINGNPTKKYTDLGFNGTETQGAPIDASGMEFFNMDIWSPNMDEIKVKLVDFLGDGFQGANGDTEAELTFPVTKGVWTTIKIPLSDFGASGMTAFNDLNQYIFSSVPFGSGILYIDNVFFSRMPTSSNDLEETKLISVYPNPVKSGERLYTSEEVSYIEMLTYQGQVIKSAKANFINIGEINSGAYLIRTTTRKGVQQVSKIVVQ